MVAVVVPTVREESYNVFLEQWGHLFLKHEVLLVKITDGDEPKVEAWQYGWDFGNFKEEREWDFSGVSDLIFNKNDGVRNLGFYLIAKHYPEIKTIITLDDDTLPLNDTIQDHIDTLNRKVPISWIKSCSEYTRGFPYCVRDEAPVMISHGLWKGVADWDAPSQLVNGNPEIGIGKYPVPKGIYMPFCGMNVAFKREALPYMYYAPMGYKVGMDRFADIWLGINLTRICAEKNWAIYNGGAVVRHERASNVWKNLQKEARGLELNETYWSGDESDPYFKLYNEKREAWEKLIKDVGNL